MKILMLLQLIWPVFSTEDIKADLGEIDLLEGVPQINQTIDEGETLEEEWVQSALLDLAYYLRSHKFNEYDRRYKTEANGIAEYYKKFPEPHLRTFHWEVKRFCSIGFIDCLRYAKTFLEKSRIPRENDTVYTIFRNKWAFSGNQVEIEAADKECKRHYKEEWESGYPFESPLQRFQWRTTLSYFMCHYTLQGLPILSAFGERCDNYANCLWLPGTVSTSDPRADDSKPFACATYSFCPDPCCPVKNIANMESCYNLDENPCPKENSNRTCSIISEYNLDITSIASNQWNLTCSCNEKGFTFDSRFGICVDIDECEMGTHNCTFETETCLNLRGTYGCICSFGYKWDETTSSCHLIASLMSHINAPDFILEDTEKQKRKEHLKKKEDDESSKTALTLYSSNLKLFLGIYLIFSIGIF